MGNVGYALAPTERTEASGWLWTWGFAIPVTANNPDRAWEFIRWSTSAEFVALVGQQGRASWADAPPGTRFSTYENPAYQEATEGYGQVVLNAIRSADPNNPGTTGRVGLPGVGYVGIPQFQSIASDCTIEISAAIAGEITVDESLDRCQDIAAQVEGLPDGRPR